MDLIAWEDSLSVGVSEIDNQHRRLIGFINQLADFMVGGKDIENPLQSVLSGLFNYTVYHFFTEEQIMENVGYPNYDAHRAAHINLTATVIVFLDRFIRGEQNIHQEVFSFLKQWLLEHIRVTDKELGDYLQTRR